MTLYIISASIFLAGAGKRAQKFYAPTMAGKWVRFEEMAQTYATLEQANAALKEAKALVNGNSPFVSRQKASYLVLTVGTAPENPSKP